MQAHQPHRVAIRDFSGQIEVVEADEIHFCVPTKECAQFWITIVACFVSIGIGIWFMVWQGTTSTYFFIGEALLSTALGILIPGPNWETLFPKQQVLLHGPTGRDENSHPQPRGDDIV